MEEYFWPHESLVANFDLKLLFRHIVHSAVVFHPLGGVRLVLSEFLGNVGTDVAKALFDRL